jgi:glycosyltransferase involved in cell wall biosynthesis
VAESGLISVSSMTETLVPKNYRAIIDQLTKENGFDEGLPNIWWKSFGNVELLVYSRHRIDDSSRVLAMRCGRMTADGWLSVLIPVYNEEQTIELVVTKVLELGSVVKEVIIVDDGSTDGTAEVVDGLVTREPLLRFFRMGKNQGKTAAIRFALEKVEGRVVIIQDADLEYDPAEIPAVVAPISDGHADVVYGSRFMTRKASRVLYFYHYLANQFLTFLSNVLTNRNMSDIETGYKAFRTGVIKPLELTSTGFGMEVEITAMICKTQARTYEVPISYYGRSYEEGKKIGVKDGIMAIVYIFYYNLVQPLLPAGRKYVAEVDRYLKAQERT